MAPFINKRDRKSSGQSLVSVLIAVAIAGIVVIAVASMMSVQQNETRALTEKLASLDFTRVVTSLLADSNSCSALFFPANVSGGAASLTFDASRVSVTSPLVIGLTTLAGASAGVAVSPLSTSLVIAPTNGIQLSVISPTAASVLVNFNLAKVVRPLKQLSFPVTLQSSGVLANTTITGCGGGATTPPVCNSPNKTLHWSGSAWSCDSIAFQGGTPCGAGNVGVTMHLGGAWVCCTAQTPTSGFLQYGGGPFYATVLACQ
jgi:Tfp pilus assembly protein PilV